MIVKAIKITAINLLVFCGLLMLMEVTLQGIAIIWPSYNVLFLQPDRVLGWKQVPNLRWQWAGHYWYASDFSVPVATNALGFRESIREPRKPHGVKRVALLGDSFIEAVQVPFKNTGGQRLEQLLNSPSHRSLWRWEVLNFGVSNYGVGQYMLTWDQYVNQYQPDYVAIFVADFHMKRTVMKFEDGAFPESKSSLWVRPTFRAEDGRLIPETARDFEEFVNVQNTLIRTEFDGQRSRRNRQLITLYYARQLKNQVLGLIKLPVSNRKSTNIVSVNDLDGDADMLAVNLRIIRDLGRKVSDRGGKLIVLDVSRYFGDDEVLSTTLEKLCSENDLGYIPVYKDLLSANMRGISTRWPHDGHFNYDGNEILARTIFAWLGPHPEPSQAVR